MTGERPSLVFIEEGDGGDNGVGAVLNDEIPMRVVAMLRFEVHTYYLRYGWEWIGIESLEDSH